MLDSGTANKTDMVKRKEKTQQKWEVYFMSWIHLSEWTGFCSWNKWQYGQPFWKTRHLSFI